MRRAILNKVYRLHQCPQQQPTILNLVRKYGIEKAGFVIEAGCHDGSDTLAWLDLGVHSVFAFEPDYVAYIKAKSLLSSFIVDKRVVLHNCALSETRQKISLDFITGRGDGNTQIRPTGGVADQGESYSVPLDELLHQFELRSIEDGHGFLWLDVEGHALQVIRGGTKSLRFIEVAKIEVEFLDISPFRVTNWLQVIRVMRQLGFKVLRADIHPGRFGDILFIRGKRGVLFLSLIDAYFTLLSRLLRGAIYPTLRVLNLVGTPTKTRNHGVKKIIEK